MSESSHTNSSPFWKIRVCLPGSIIHLVSRTEPIVRMHDGRVADVDMTLVTDTPDDGDAVGFIDWQAAVAVTWRAAVVEDAIGTRRGPRATQV
jgi:hypothetical protein